MEKNFLIARIVANTLPKIWLPTGTKIVNGTRMPLSEWDRRDKTQREINWRMNKFLDRVSPLRRYCAHIENERHSANLREIHEKVGKVALLHFAIEAGLRETLLNDWDVPRSFDELASNQSLDQPSRMKKIEVDKLFGKYLRKQFLKELRKRNLPERFQDSYKTLDKEFAKLSDDRNKVVKASYVVSHDYIGISKPVTTDERARAIATEVQSEDVLADLRKLLGVTPFSTKEIDELHSNLCNLNERYMRLRVKVWLDKQKLVSQNTSIGVPFPAAAKDNPYSFFSNDS